MAEMEEKQAWDEPKQPAKQDTMRSLARAVSGEFAAMFTFIFVCVGTALTTTGTSPTDNMPDVTAKLSISLCFGLTIFVLAHCFGHISGAHVNPAVTLSLICGQQIAPVKGCLYMLAQFVASIAANGILMAVMGLKPETMGGYNAIAGNDDNRVARGFIIEMFLTYVLVFTVYATIDPNRGDKSPNGPLAIGMAVGIAHIMAVPVTGCGINPARSLGTAVFADNDAAKDDLWVFLIAPFIGGVLAAVSYKYWYAEKPF